MDWAPKVPMMIPSAQGPKLEMTIYQSAAFIHRRLLPCLNFGSLFLEK
jgi:hypothetical protein